MKLAAVFYLPILFAERGVCLCHSLADARAQLAGSMLMPFAPQMRGPSDTHGIDCGSNRGGSPSVPPRKLAIDKKTRSIWTGSLWLLSPDYVFSMGSQVRICSVPSMARSMSASPSSSSSACSSSANLGLVAGWRGVNTVQQSSKGKMEVS